VMTLVADAHLTRHETPGTLELAMARHIGTKKRSPASKTTTLRVDTRIVIVLAEHTVRHGNVHVHRLVAVLACDGALGTLVGQVRREVRRVHHIATLGARLVAAKRARLQVLLQNAFVGADCAGPRAPVFLKEAVDRSVADDELDKRNGIKIGNGLVRWPRFATGGALRFVALCQACAAKKMSALYQVGRVAYNLGADGTDEMVLGRIHKACDGIALRLKRGTQDSIVILFVFLGCLGCGLGVAHQEQKKKKDVASFFLISEGFFFKTNQIALLFFLSPLPIAPSLFFFSFPFFSLSRNVPRQQ